MGSVQTSGTVVQWDPALGWGVLESAETPGGCWFHFSVVEHEAGGGSADTVLTRPIVNPSVGDRAEFTFIADEVEGFPYSARKVLLRPV